MINLEKGSESNKERHLGKQMDKKNVAQLQENSGSEMKKQRRTKIYNPEGINSNLIQCEKIQIQRETQEVAQIHTYIYTHICNSLIHKVNYRLITTLIIVSLLIAGVFFLFVSHYLRKLSIIDYVDCYSTYSFGTQVQCHPSSSKLE